MKTLKPIPLLVFVFSLLYLTLFASPLPERDIRGEQIVDLNTPRSFPEIKNLSEWQKRAKEIRAQVLVSAGLYPMPERPPLKATVFGKTEYKDFSVEKVYIESLPGFYLCGNLYRPVGKGSGPFPAVLNPHGHWKNGRLEDSDTGSIPARCISFARMGMVAFSYDMVGYNDTLFRMAGSETGYAYHRSFGTNEVDQLWGISLMGLQLWNSIRALDFLMSLPEVDKSRVACTGASGGGTQTFILGAVDDRLSVLAPTVMVSHSMQGGCGCENMPGLRIEYSNMEIATVPAPKPQIFMASTGDWTKTFMTIEGPSISKIYSLFKATNRVYYEVLPFGHNYNKTTREAVYKFFDRWLLGKKQPPFYKEEPYPPATNLDLRVFPDKKLPSDAATQEQVREWLMKRSIRQIESLIPADKPSLANYKSIMLPAWRYTLQTQFSTEKIETIETPSKKHNSLIERNYYIGVKGRGDRLPVTIFEPVKTDSKIIVILISPRGRGAFLDSNGLPLGIAIKLVERGFPVMLIDTFMTGELLKNKNLQPQEKRDYFSNFFTTYNRTDCQERVGDIYVASEFAKRRGYKVVLYGEGRAGLWTMLAAPVCSGLIADADQFNSENDNSLLARDIFVPGIRRIGSFEGVLALAAPNPVLIHNTGTIFKTSTIRRVYNNTGASNAIEILTKPVNDREILDWLSENRRRI
ncbi:MAG: alpha/beta hydrolase family protein [Verrucomicrobiia bacterium]